MFSFQEALEEDFYPAVCEPGGEDDEGDFMAGYDGWDVDFFPETELRAELRLFSGKVSDFTIICRGGRTILVHRAVLAQVSYFAALFKGPFREQESDSLDIDEEPLTVMELMRWIYCQDAAVGKDVVLDLHRLAEFYGIEELIDHCARGIFALGVKTGEVTLSASQQSNEPTPSEQGAEPEPELAPSTQSADAPIDAGAAQGEVTLASPEPVETYEEILGDLRRAVDTYEVNTLTAPEPAPSTQSSDRPTDAGAARGTTPKKPGKPMMQFSGRDAEDKALEAMAEAAAEALGRPSLFDRPRETGGQCTAVSPLYSMREDNAIGALDSGEMSAAFGDVAPGPEPTRRSPADDVRRKDKEKDC